MAEELGDAAVFSTWSTQSCFADASVIAPLGAISVLSNAFIAALVLGEGLRCRDLIGCCLCIAGGAVIVDSRNKPLLLFALRRHLPEKR